MSTSTTSSAWSNTVSGTVSATRMPVMPPTTSFRLSRCCTLTVVKTSMPASSSSSTSCQRLGWREPGAFECASSSTRISAGLPRQRRVEVEFADASCRGRRAVWAAAAPGPSSMAAVSARPWVSSTPTSGDRPSACSLRAAASMA